MGLAIRAHSPNLKKAGIREEEDPKRRGQADGFPAFPVATRARGLGKSALFSFPVGKRSSMAKS